MSPKDSKALAGLAPSASLRCPQCGTPLVANPAPSRREIIRGMVDEGHKPEYAADRADRRLEKEADLGVVCTCPRCRYVTRAPALAGAASESGA